jgi:endonuclease/exonuclease/phosphatase family metal-dependent hydrolase
MKWYKHLLLLACGASLLAACSNTKELELEVMSFNIRYDEPNDGTNSWDNRKDQVLSLLKFEDVDLLGTQEVLHHQLLDISAGLPDYTEG